MRRVSVAMRLRARLDGRGRQAEQDVVYVRSELPEADWKKGLRPVQPGETIVTEGVLELKAELENLQAKKNAKK
jgi:hypothetical protein